MDSLTPIDSYFQLKEEPVRSCLQALREYILAYDEKMEETWKYKMPMYCYKGKMFCYLWVHKKLGQPYIGIVEGRKIEHPDLMVENRNRMKIMLMDAEQEIPIEKLDAIFKMAKAFY